MSWGVRLTIPGRPRPKGSSKWIPSATTGKSVPAHNANLEHWTASVTLAAQRSYGRSPTDGGVRVVIDCFFRRPKAHYRTGRKAHLLREDAPSVHVQTPDVDKLARAILDALTGVIYHDDSQVSALMVTKAWSDVDEALITITSYE